MAPACRPFDRSSAYAAILLAAGVCALAGPAPAARPWFNAFGAERTESGHHGEAPHVARYLVDDGGVFVLDRSAREPLLKFDDSPEIWALFPSRGPRGDVIYKNDVGEPMLRFTRLGGLTVFTVRRPGGSAASVAGVTSALRLASIGPVALYQRLFQASVRSSRAAQHLVGFEAPDADPASDGLIADAAVVVTEAMVTLSSRADGKPFLARVAKVVFRVGKQPQAKFADGAISVTLVPPLGIAGRPSSRRILWAVSTARR